LLSLLALCRIGLALVAAAKGYKCTLAMPASLAEEKINTMKTLGAEVIHSVHLCLHGNGGMIPRFGLVFA